MQREIQGCVSEFVYSCLFNSYGYEMKLVKNKIKREVEEHKYLLICSS